MEEYNPINNSSETNSTPVNEPQLTPEKTNSESITPETITPTLSNPQPSANITLSPGEMPRVLVAEDDAFLIQVHEKKLAKEGFEVTIARNGQEAIDFAKEKKPDIIILDLIMPIKDGFETLKELKSDPELKEIKVVVMTNLSQDEDRERVMNLGAVDFIVKSNISFKEVVQNIKQHLNIS